MTDRFSDALLSVRFTSRATGKASGYTPSGEGDIEDTVNMASGSTITYKVTAQLRRPPYLYFRLWITAAAVARYQADRLEDGAAPATVNLETSAQGVSFIEDRAGWHHRVPTEEELDAALDELRGACR